MPSPVKATRAIIESRDMYNPPRRDPSDPDRQVELQEMLEGILKAVLHEAEGHGWGAEETIDAMGEVLENLRLAESGLDPNEARSAK